jgi:arsenate reductase
MAQVRRTFDYLLNDCCRGRPDLCAPAPTRKGGPDMADKKYNVLFICVGNSARSIFAETILRDMAGDRFTAYSAGTRPFSELNPFAVEVLKAKGHDVSHLRAKNVSAFTGPDAPVMDFVFTVCDRAANEECPPWEGQPVTGHWGTPDPVRAEGTDAQKALAFQHAYGALYNRISAFAALPFDTLDRVSLQSAVDDIGRQPNEARA